MSEPIYHDDLVVHTSNLGDAEQIVGTDLISTICGPAGEAEIQLSSELRVAVDYAQPDQLTSISIEVDTPVAAEQLLNDEQSGLLESLVGTERIEAVREAVSGSLSAPIRIPGVRPRATSLPQDPGEIAVRLGQVASLTSILEDHDEAMSVRVVAAFEGVSIARRLGDRALRQRLINRFRDLSVEALGDDDRRDAVRADILEDLKDLRTAHPGVAQEVAKIVEGVGDALSDPFDDVVESIREVLRGPVGRSLVMAAPDFEQPLALAMSFQLQTAIRDFQERVIIDSSRSGRLELFWDTDPVGSWVRIMNPDDLTLVALVPVRRVDDQWVAEAIVPPDRPLNTWVIEVTDTPVTSAAKSTGERIIEAVRLGQIAARKRRGTNQDPEEYRAAWLACAAAWQELGDITRTNKARAYADGDWVTRQDQVADRVRTALGLDSI
jgi:hypothetical protein